MHPPTTAVIIAVKELDAVYDRLSAFFALHPAPGITVATGGGVDPPGDSGDSGREQVGDR